MEENLKLFLSHASRNSSTMLQFAEELEGRGYACWYAPRDIPYGDNYLTEIVDALDEVDAVILLHSKEVHDSNYVFREIQYADNQNKLIIPLMIDDAEVSRSLELIISTMQMLNLANFPSIPSAIDELQERLENYKESRKHGGFSSGWLHRIERKIGLSNTVQLGSLTGFQVRQNVIEQMKAVYVPSPALQEHDKTAGTTRVFILQNEKKTGKYTAGISLLAEKKCDSITELLPTLTLSELVRTPLKPATGYIIDAVDLSFFEHSTPAVLWNELDARLQQIDSYIVLTTAESIQGLPVPVIKLVAPDPEAVLKRHAAHLNIESTLNGFLSRLEPYIAGRLPGEIAEMAKQLLSVENGIQSFEEAEQRFQYKVEERITQWFKKNGPSLDHIAHYIVLAIVKETSDRAYQEMVKSLKDTLKPVWESSSSEFMTDDDRMDLLTAERIMIKVNTDLNITTEDGIRLQHKEEASDILFIFWNMFRQARPLLIEWLDSQIRKVKQNERNSMEDAIAVFASKDFLQIRQLLLQKWAKDEDINLRLSTARILSKMVMENLRTQEISYLVNSWGSQKHNSRLQSTAVTALGSETGFFLYPKSLSLLKTAFLSNTRANGYLARQSFIHLSSLGEIDSHYDEVFMEFFTQWLAEEFEKTHGSIPKSFLFFFFSIISQCNFAGLTGEALAKRLLPFVVAALMTSQTKGLALDYFFKAAQMDASRIAPLVHLLLYHSKEAVRSRMLSWIKSGLSSGKKEIYHKLYSEIKKLQGGITV
jgi:TIR domain